METQRHGWMALLGLLLSLPTFIIIATGMLKLAGMTFLAETMNNYFPPQSLLLHPAIVLGGLLISVGINIIPIFSVNFEPQQRGLVTTITTHFRMLNMVTLALSLFLLCGLLMYAVGENFKIVLQ